MAGRPLPAHQLPPLSIKAQLRWEMVRPVVEAAAPRSVIEVGAGQGALSTRIAALAGGAYTGCEPDLRSQEVAAARLAPLGGLVAPCSLEQLDPAPADMVCAFEVLEHIEDDAAALRSWLRYLTTGGTLLLTVPADASRFGPSDTFAGHHRRYDPDRLRALLEAAGLEDVTVQRYAAPLGYALEAVRHRIDARKLRSAAEQAVEERTAASGRTFQFSGPSPLSRAVGLAVAPFARLQRVWPGGPGLIATGRLLHGSRAG